jgi:hypothetical protein
MERRGGRISSELCIGERVSAVVVGKVNINIFGRQKIRKKRLKSAKISSNDLDWKSEEFQRDFQIFLPSTVI